MPFLKLFSWLRTAVLPYVKTGVRLTLLCQTIDLCTFPQRSLAAILLCFPFFACSSVSHQPKLRSASAITCSVIKCSCCLLVRQLSGICRNIHHSFVHIISSTVTLTISLEFQPYNWSTPYTTHTIPDVNPGIH